MSGEIAVGAGPRQEPGQPNHDGEARLDAERRDGSGSSTCDRNPAHREAPGGDRPRYQQQVEPDDARIGAERRTQRCEGRYDGQPQVESIDRLPAGSEPRHDREDGGGRDRHVDFERHAIEQEVGDDPDHERGRGRATSDTWVHDDLRLGGHPGHVARRSMGN